MDEITLDIQDRQGRVITVHVLESKTIGEIAELAADTLALPRYNDQGYPLEYALYDSQTGGFLNRSLAAHVLNLQSGDHLHLYPQANTDLYDLELKTKPNPGFLYPVPQGEASVGREFDNDIVVRHKSVSRQHGIFEWQDGFHFYLDLGSANGSWINQQPVMHRTPIADGDVLQLGQDVRLLYRARLHDFGDEADQNLDEILTEIKPPASRTELVEVPKTQVYISYHPQEKEVVRALRDGLRKQQIKAWVDPREAKKSMARSDAMLVLLSRAALGVEILQQHWKYFATLRKPIIPILVEPCPIPDEMAESPTILEYHQRDDALLQDTLSTLADILS